MPSSRLPLPLVTLLSIALAVSASGQSTAPIAIPAQGPKGALTLRAAPWLLGPGTLLTKWKIPAEIVALENLTPSPGGSVIATVTLRGKGPAPSPKALLKVTEERVELLVRTDELPRAYQGEISLEDPRLAADGHLLFSVSFSDAGKPPQLISALFHGKDRQFQVLVPPRTPMSTFLPDAPASQIISSSAAAIGDNGQVALLCRLMPANAGRSRGSTESINTLLLFKDGKFTKAIQKVTPADDMPELQPDSLSDNTRDIIVQFRGTDQRRNPRTAAARIVAGELDYIRSPHETYDVQDLQVTPSRRAFFCVSNVFYLTEPEFKSPTPDLFPDASDTRSLRLADDGTLLAIRVPLRNAAPPTFTLRDPAGSLSTFSLADIPLGRNASILQPYTALAAGGYFVAQLELPATRRAFLLRDPARGYYIVTSADLLRATNASNVDFSTAAILPEGQWIVECRQTDPRTGRNVGTRYLSVNMKP